MHQYMVDTEFAVTQLLRLATEEEATLAGQSAILAGKEAEARVHQWDFESSDLNDDFSDMHVMGAFGRMARAANESNDLRQQVLALQANVAAHQQATQAIAGAVLQIAKQGIALVYGEPAKAPPGRMVGSLPSRDIIWQARNQALHYEEGAFRKPVSDVFLTLEKEQGDQFSLAKHAAQSRAKQVLRLLGWVDFPSFAQDMSKIIP